MKIAFVSDAVFPWHVGGLEEIERTEAEALAKDHEVHFFSLQWPGMKRHFTENDVHYHTFFRITRERFYRHKRRSILTALRFSIGCFRLYFYKFDIMELNMFPILHIPILKLYCKLTGCKLILDVVEVWSRAYWDEYLGTFLGGLAYWYTTYFLNSASIYIANSSVTAEKLREADIDLNRISIFQPVLVDHLLAKMKSSKRAKPQIMLSARLIPDKRIDKWLRIVKEVNKKYKKATALLIGGGPDKEKIEDLIEKLGLQRVVKLLPFYEERRDVYKDIASSAVVLQMSEREGLSMIALESLALGVPVVLPKYSPIPNEVKEMCVVEDEKKIPGKIIEILKSKDRSKFIKNKENLSKFSVSQTSRFYTDLFKRMGWDRK